MNRNGNLARLLRVLVIALFAPGYVSVASTSQIEYQLKQGRQSLAAQDYTKAAAAFEIADRVAGGRSWLARIGLARTYFAMGQYREALSQGRQALNISADAREQAESHFEIGRTYYSGWPRMDLQQQEAMTKAIEELDLAAKLLPKLGSGSLGMQVAALFEVGAKDRAEEILQNSRTNGVKITGVAAGIQCFLDEEERSDVFRPDVNGENGPVITKPKLRRPPRPLYPESARLNGEQGLVRLQVIVSQQG